LCAAHGIPLDVLRVAVDRDGPQGLEAAARAARYAALASALRPGEWLLTAHHGDDQLETVLIQLLRGAGVAGLAAMPRVARLGPGRHGRPLLGLARADLESLVAAAGVVVVADPMNADRRHDRAWLRQTILPALRSRWPAAAATVARSAVHCAEAHALLGQLASSDAAAAVDGPRLTLAPLQPLDRARRANALRWWLQREGLPLPSTARLDEVLRQMWSAAPEALPVVRWRGGEVHRYRGALYALKASPAPITGVTTLRPGTMLAIGHGLGRLHLEPASGEGIRAAFCERGLTVRARHGGEQLRLHRDGPKRALRLLYQEAGIVPWWRASLPLLWDGDELVAVADRWINADVCATHGEPGYLPMWSVAPPLT
jgi:tRNA(Ile)-lysidine synthase